MEWANGAQAVWKADTNSMTPRAILEAAEVDTELGLSGQPLYLETIGDVQRPQRDAGEQQRQREGEHLAQQGAPEAAEAERVAASHQQHRVHDVGAGEVADHDAQAAHVEPHDEKQRYGDRQRDIDEREHDEVTGRFSIR